MPTLHSDYIIIGAGPSGLQLGYFLEKTGREYTILESTDGVGSFYRRFPRTRSLISFNRPPYPTDDEEFQWRGDWNSLLSTDGPRFRDFDQRLLPSADSMVRYLEAFAAYHGLRIRLGSPVVSIERDTGMFRLTGACGQTYTARVLIVATGLTPRNPPITGIEHVFECYENASLEEEAYRGQRVMILGKRNSAFEIANVAQQTASIVLMVSPNPLVLAWNTKHSGHTRANLVGPLDTYQLKLVLTKLLDASVASIERHDGKFLVRLAYTHAQGEVETFIVDKLINCTGFEMNGPPFAEACRPETVIDDRFPALTSSWESQNIPDLYFIGAVAQSNDFQKASSPFVGGFRYNIRALFHLLEERYQGVPLPCETPPSDPARLADWLVRNITRRAGNFFQFDYLSDVLVWDDGRLRYYRELPIAYIHERFGDSPLYILVSFAWGDHDGDVFAIPRQPEAEFADRSAFIHPVLRVFRRGRQTADHHLLEDLFAVFCCEVHDAHYVRDRAGLSVGEWHARHHVEPLERFLREQLDLRSIDAPTELAKSA